METAVAIFGRFATRKLMLRYLPNPTEAMFHWYTLKSVAYYARAYSFFSVFLYVLYYVHAFMINKFVK